MVKRKPIHKTPYDIEYEMECFHRRFGVRKKFLKSIISSLDLPLEGVALDIECSVGSNSGTLESAGSNVIGINQSVFRLPLYEGEDITIQ
jgi:2-polyprenyl-3-methyl-5-hydroxy-6-metoxy-1,4-benzoquinol methylase